MNPKIEIKSTDVTIKKGVSSRNNKEYEIHEQRAYFHKPGEEVPYHMVVALEKNAPAYPIGFYTLDNDSLFINQYQQLKLGNVKLKPLNGAVAKAS